MGSKRIQPFALLILASFLTLLIPACSSTFTSNDRIQPTIPIEIPPTSSGPPGSSQSNPARFGSEVIVDNLIFIISDTIRPADGIVSAGDMFNSQPGQYQHYIFVNLLTNCKPSADLPCHLSPFKFKLIGTDGLLEYPERLISGVDGILEDTDIQAGASFSSILPFIIPIGASHLQLVYDSVSGGSFYLALP